jgi:hypothetical protein
MYNLSSFAQSERLISNLISSGGSNMSIDNIHLKASMGQTIIGVTNFNNTKNSQGFWYVVSNQSLTTSNDLEPITSELNVNIYPNPLSLNGILELNCENTEHVNICLFDINGKKLKLFFDGILPVGKNKIELDFSNFSVGTYIIKVINKKNEFIKKIVIFN